MRKAKMPVVLAAAASGGGSSLNSLQNADTTAEVHIVPDKRIVWDQTREGKLHLGQIIDSTGAGLRKPQGDVTNNYAYHVDFVYKVEWFDASGMKIDADDNWERPRLEATRLPPSRPSRPPKGAIST